MIRKWGIEDSRFYCFHPVSCSATLWWSAAWSLNCNQIPLLSVYTYERSSVKVIKAAILAFLHQELISYITYDMQTIR